MRVWTGVLGVLSRLASSRLRDQIISFSVGREYETDKWIEVRRTGKSLLHLLEDVELVWEFRVSPLFCSH
jgi:hypothetical protein